MASWQLIYDIAQLCALKGIRSAILCPGSRSAPLTLAFSRHPKIKSRTFSDERSAAFIAVGIAQQTDIQYLSGTGNDHTVNWDFYCTAGNHSGKWTTIPVPSCWELQGFGKYNYGLKQVHRLLLWEKLWASCTVPQAQKPVPAQC